MLKLIEANLKQIETLKQSENKKEEIKKLKANIYSAILGYYACKKDMRVFLNSNDIEIINNIIDKIQNILNTPIPVLNMSKNSLHSMALSIRSLMSENENLCTEYLNILNYFSMGYGYYIENLNITTPAFDELSLYKQINFENVLTKIKVKID